MAYNLIGANAVVTSWGSTNFYSTCLAAITPNSARITITNDDQEVTGIGAFASVMIPGLKSANVVLGGYAGSSPYLGNAGAITSTGTPNGYVTTVQSWEWIARTPTVHDITPFGGTPTWKTFRPDIFTSSLRYTALVDSSTSLAPAPDAGGGLQTVTLTYVSGGTIAMSGLIRQIGVTAARGNKQLVTYQLDGSSTVTTAGGIFGSFTMGGANNTHPLWSAGGSAAGAMVVTLGTGKTISLADSFYTNMRVSCAPSAPVAVEFNVQATGAVSIA